jgi:hypothetical protein
MAEELFDLNIDSISDDMLIDDSTIDIANDTTSDDVDSTAAKAAKDNLIDLDAAIGGDEDVADDKSGDTNPKTKQTSSPVFADTVNTFASALYEEGVLPSLNTEEFSKLPKEEKTKALIAAVNTEMNSKLEGWIDNLPPQLKKALVNYTEGVPLKDILESDAVETAFGSITQSQLESNEDVRKKVIKQDYLMRGIDPAKAEKLAQRSVDLGEDLEDAKGALTNIMSYENTKIENKKHEERQRQASFEQAKKAQIDNIKKSIDNTQEIIPGVKLTPALKDKVFKSMTTILGEDEQGRPYNKVTVKRNENPISFDTKMNYYIELGLFDEKPDFGKLTNTLKTQAVRKLEDTFNGISTKGAGKPFEHDYTENQIASRILGKF